MNSNENKQDKLFLLLIGSTVLLISINFLSRFI